MAKMTFIEEYGTEEGERCGRDDCEGVMGIVYFSDCHCHLGCPPCSSCTDALIVCPECGAEGDRNGL